MTTSSRIAIVGATGMVGTMLLTLLNERRFPVDALYLLASERSAGQTLSFRGQSLTVQPVSRFDFTQTDLCFFAAGEQISADYAEKAAAAGNLVIDKSSYFRMHPEVPLVVPEVNPEALALCPKNIIASPNCSTIPVVMALRPLHKMAGITRINVATYQSVSGSGQEGVTELAEQTALLLNGQPVIPRHYVQQIAFNILPLIDVLEENGYSREEMKLMHETGKILNDPSIVVNATAARVPVFYGHSAAVHLETRDKLPITEALALLASAPGVRLIQPPAFPTPVHDAAEQDDVVVGRVREDPSHPHGISLWVVGDNIRKGAALNAIQIAETILSKKRKEKK